MLKVTTTAWIFMGVAWTSIIAVCGLALVKVLK